jgi:3-hydroxyacyl-CoA dehydrogenase
MGAKVLSEMVKVGKDLLDRSIVDEPEMVDLAMIWGTGFPSEKGGPLKWADVTGLSEQLLGQPFYKSK